MFIDLQDLSFETISLKRSDSCPVCGKAGTAPRINNEKVTEICGREGNRVFIFSTENDHKLDLLDIKRKIKSLGYKIKIEGEIGISFTKNHIKGSIMSSGVTILEGLPDKCLAIKLHQDLLL